MAFTLHDPLEDTQATTNTFNDLLSKTAKAVLYNVWEFAERKPSAIYVFVDFDQQAIDTFLMLDGNLYLPLDLHLLPAYDFDPLPVRRDKFMEYLQRDIKELGDIWHRHGKMKPRRLWFGIFDEMTREKLVLDYTPKSTALPSPEEAVVQFRNDVLLERWPSLLPNLKL